MSTMENIKDDQAVEYLLALEKNAMKKGDGRPSIQEVAEQMGIHRSTIYRFTERYIKAGILDSEYRLTEYGYEWLQDWRIKKRRLEKLLKQYKIHDNSIAHNVNVLMESCTDDLVAALCNSVFSCNECKYHPKEASESWYSVNGENFREKLGKHIPNGSYPIHFNLFKDNDQGLLELSMAHAGFKHPATLEMKDGEGTVRLVLRTIEQQSASGKWFRGEAGSIRCMMDGEWKEFPIEAESVLLPMTAFWLTYEGEDFRQIRGMTRIRISCTSGMEAMGEGEAILQIKIRK